MSKSFVSLSFSDPKKLQVAVLNRSRNKVEKYLTIDLPEGLIVKHKVEDIDSLSKILKGVWHKLKIREKYVGIVVPEFSTYVKTLIIPKLSPGELDEAVKWQAQEYLPIDINEVSLDWRIIGKTDSSTSVLVVCIDKRILTSYVQSAAGAGLYPIIVETPSLSLARANHDEGGKLIIYKTSSDAIFVVAKGEEIFGSSATDITDFSAVSALAKRMINHYEGAGVSEIKFGGYEFDRQLESLLEKETGKKVSIMKINLTGLTEAKTQEYLIPLSLQMNEPSAPSDQSTVNLLPAELVKYYTFEKLRSQSWSLAFLSSVIIWAIFVAVCSAYLYIINQLNSFTKENQARGNIIEEQKEVAAIVLENNTLFEQVINISSSSVVMGKIVNEINSAKPEGIKIDSYKFNFENGVFEFSGISTDRMSLIKYKQNLEGNEKISNIDIPISSLEIEANLVFTVKFNYDVGIKKTQVKPKTPSVSEEKFGL